VTHTDAGTWKMEGPVWRFNESVAHIRMNAPRFGEHNDLIFRALLGRSSESLAQLALERVIGEEPDLAAHNR
jgi:crotonobetainyl-CoA:carnitine CoA-transferase CaiB-like acyl-CoA transferase